MSQIASVIDMLILSSYLNLRKEKWVLLWDVQVIDVNDKLIMTTG